MNIRNHVQLIGRLGANPDMKVLDNGTRMARFSIAVTETFTTAKGEKVTDVQWHSITAWGRLADVAERLLFKGTEVSVDGKLLKRVYTNRHGVKCSSTDIVANELLVNYTQAA